MAYVPGLQAGFSIVNVSDPYNPFLVSNFHRGYYTNGVYEYDGYVYVAENPFLTIVDVSNPSQPHVEGLVNINSFDVCYKNGYCFSVGWAERLRAIDVGNPAQPFVAAVYPDSISGNNVCADDNYIYVAEAHSLMIFRFSPLAIDDDNSEPSEFCSIQSYPNPFNSNTTIIISNSNNAQISISDITGCLVATLKAEKGQAVWDAEAFTSGIYFARVKDGDKAQSIKLILLK